MESKIVKIVRIKPSDYWVAYHNQDIATYLTFKLQKDKECNFIEFNTKDKSTRFIREEDLIHYRINEHYKDEKIYSIPLSEIKFPESTFSFEYMLGLKQLSESIRVIGLKNPIEIKLSPIPKKYKIISGEGRRRYFACILAGKTEIEYYIK